MIPSLAADSGMRTALISTQNSLNVNQAHSLAKLHTAVLEAHSPADGIQPGSIVLNGRTRILYKITCFLECMDNCNAQKKMCNDKCDFSARVATLIC